MTREQKQSEIIKKLETVPEGILQEVLDYLNDFERKSPKEQKRILALREVLCEKRGLFLRLAHS